VAYTLLLQISDTSCHLQGTIKIDRATGKYAGAFQTEEGKHDLKFIEIAPGERLRFVKHDPQGGLVSYEFRPDPETPVFPEGMRDSLTWWVGQSYDGQRLANARCVLSRGPVATDAVPKSAPAPVTRCAVLDPHPHSVPLM